MRRLARLAGGSSSIDRSAMVGLLFAVVALLAASAAVRGPAVPERATVVWPDPSVALAPVDASSDPPVQWYSPLLLSNHRPERLVVHLPCRVAPTSPVFATTRAADDGTRLEVAAVGESLRVRLGQQILTEVPWPDGTSGCEGTLVFDVGAWSLDREGMTVASGEASPPLLSGLYTGLDPAGSAPVRAELTTVASSSRPSSCQWLFTAAAVLAGGAALALVTRRRPPDAPPSEHLADEQIAKSPRANRLADTGEPVVIRSTSSWWRSR